MSQLAELILRSLQQQWGPMWALGVHPLRQVSLLVMAPSAQRPLACWFGKRSTVRVRKRIRSCACWQYKTNEHAKLHARLVHEMMFRFGGYSRSATATYSRSVGPTYAAFGRIRRLFAACSITCADQPAIRDIANAQVNWSIGNPIIYSTMDE